jgi:hypothetical protein
MAPPAAAPFLPPPPVNPGHLLGGAGDGGIVPGALHVTPRGGPPPAPWFPHPNAPGPHGPPAFAEPPHPPHMHPGAFPPMQQHPMHQPPLPPAGFPHVGPPPPQQQAFAAPPLRLVRPFAPSPTATAASFGHPHPHALAGAHIGGGGAFHPDQRPTKRRSFGPADGNLEAELDRACAGFALSQLAPPLRPAPGAPWGAGPAAAVGPAAAACGPAAWAQQQLPTPAEDADLLDALFSC